MAKVKPLLNHGFTVHTERSQGGIRGRYHLELKRVITVFSRLQERKQAWSWNAGLRSPLPNSPRYPAGEMHFEVGMEWLCLLDNSTFSLMGGFALRF